MNNIFWIPIALVIGLGLGLSSTVSEGLEKIEENRKVYMQYEIDCKNANGKIVEIFNGDKTIGYCMDKTLFIDVK